jgi:hypothetical protein
LQTNRANNLLELPLGGPLLDLRNRACTETIGLSRAASAFRHRKLRLARVSKSAFLRPRTLSEYKKKKNFSNAGTKSCSQWRRPPLRPPQQRQHQQYQMVHQTGHRQQQVLPVEELQLLPLGAAVAEAVVVQRHQTGRIADYPTTKNSGATCATRFKKSD